MAFQDGASLYDRIVPMGDVMNQTINQNMQRDSLRQQMQQNEIQTQAAEETMKMNKLKKAALMMDESNYGEIRPMLLELGLPAPEQYSATLDDKLKSYLGIKPKSSLQALMSPTGVPMLIDKNTGQYMEALPAGQASMYDRIMPTEQAAPVAPVTSVDQYQLDSDGTPLPNLAQLTGEGMPPLPPAVTPPAGMMPQFPPVIPDTTTGAPIPMPAKTGMPAVDVAAAKSVNEANIKLESAKRKPPTEAERMAAESRKQGQANFDKIMKDMDDTYSQLEKLGAVTSISKSGVENAKTYMRTLSDPAQYIGKVTGSAEQAAIARLGALKLRTKEAIMKASGMSAKSMDSNQELQTFLNSLGDPQVPIETNRDTLRTMWELYGTPEAAASRGQQLMSGITTSGAPAVGTVEDGYEYLGGDPSNPSSWRAK